MEGKLIDTAKEHPAIAVYIISLISIAVIIVAIYLIYKKYFRGQSCINRQIKEDRDFYKKLSETQNSNVTFLVETTKEMRAELTEHKQIMLDISKAQNSTALILNEILVRLKIQNKE